MNNLNEAATNSRYQESIETCCWVHSDNSETLHYSKAGNVKQQTLAVDCGGCMERWLTMCSSTFSCGVGKGMTKREYFFRAYSA